MKIIVLASTFPSHDKDSVPAFVKDQVIYLKKSDPKNEFYVLAPRNKKQPPIIPNKYYTEVRFPYFIKNFETLTVQGIMPSLQENRARILLIPFFMVGEFVALIRLSRKVTPDCYYAHWFMPQGVVSLLASRLTEVPTVITSHSSDVKILKKIPLGKTLVRSLLPKAVAITAVSERSLSRISDFFSNDEWSKIKARTKIIPMGINTAEFGRLKSSPSDLRKELGIRNDAVVILFLGRLAKIKGVEYLLEAFSLLISKGKKGQFFLIVAGDGPLRKQLAEKAKMLGIHKYVRFTGYVSGETKNTNLGLSDIFVLSSITMPNGDTEGFPVSLMEAMSAGKICIATNSSGADNIITSGVNGFIVAEKSPDELAESIYAAASLPESDKRSIGETASLSVKKLDWLNIAKQHLKFIEVSLK